MKRNNLMKVLLVTLCVALMLSVSCFAGDEAPTSFAYNTLWAALPPVIAIGLALITKEVYSSLFLGIFVGGLHDFGAMFASVRNGGKSVGEIIKASMGDRAKKLFIVFALLVLILVIASFVNVVAGTFYSENPAGFTTDPNGNETTAMVSVLFIVMAIIYGLMTTRFGMDTKTATIIGLVMIVAGIAFGLNVGLVLGRTAWIILVAAYITIASLAPVWILLQPRDYLSSFLLYAMMAVAVVGIFMSAFTGTAEFTIPAFTGKTGMFPTLFITVACGACSGFHSLIASGTSADLPVP